MKCDLRRASIQLQQAVVAQTPETSLNGNSVLGNYNNPNQTAIAFDVSGWN